MGGEATHQRPNAQQQDHLEETHGFTGTVDVLTPAVVASFSGERRIRATYSAASPLLLAAAVIVAIDFSPTRDVILKFVLLYSLYVLVHGTPVALAPTVVLKRQPRVALIVAMWAYGRSIEIDLVGLWLMIAGVPTGAVLLLNTRHLRAVGPIVFAATLPGFTALVPGSRTRPCMW